MILIYGYLIVGFCIVLLTEWLVCMMRTDYNKFKEIFEDDDEETTFEEIEMVFCGYEYGRNMYMPMLIFGWLPLLVYTQLK